VYVYPPVRAPPHRLASIPRFANYSGVACRTGARKDVMRKLATVICHMLSKGQTYAECRDLAA
jgi:hypothetical protein